MPSPATIPSPATMPTVVEPEPSATDTDTPTVHARPEHHGLVVTGAQRWPWYEEPQSVTSRAFAPD